ncbi:DUF4129 domain-containing protein [Reyranella sp.]|uniref:DUF4129 domain-containing protein n=1 Tax=Reyranella sp. TaxID=1929291 RepID=UPI003D109566
MTIWSAIVGWLARLKYRGNGEHIRNIEKPQGTDQLDNLSSPMREGLDGLRSISFVEAGEDLVGLKFNARRNLPWLHLTGCRPTGRFCNGSHLRHASRCRADLARDPAQARDRGRGRRMADQQNARPDPSGSRLKVVLVAAALGGLLLAVAGTMPAATDGEGVAGRLVVELPPWLSVPFLVLMSLVALYIFLVMIPGMRRRPRKTVDQQASLARMALLLLLLAPLWAGVRDHLPVDLGSLFGGFGGLLPSLANPGAEAPPAVHSAVVEGILETLLLALGLIGFGVVAWLYLAILPERGQGALPPAAAAELHGAVEDSLDDLRAMADARLAIIRCYDRFEKALAGADVRRPPWQTATEFMRTALAQPRLPADGVRELTALFEVARFSRHEIGAAHRERAWRALMAVKAALESEDAHAAAS